MSTCQGASAPHLNCPHGDRCDWDADTTLTNLAGFSARQKDEMRKANADFITDLLRQAKSEQSDEGAE